MKKSRAGRSHKQARVDLEEIWPSERDFMERPARIKYVRKLIKPKGCVFCEVEKKRPSKSSLLLYKNEISMVVLNKYPYNNGHLLVLPRAHIASLLDLEAEAYTNLSEVLKASLAIVQDAYGFKGCNIGLNQGATAGAGIPDHLHWHIIPRWLGDTNFFPLIAETKVIAEGLDQTYERLRPYVKKIKV